MEDLQVQNISFLNYDRLKIIYYYLNQINRNKIINHFRLNKVLICRENCDFTRLLSVQSNFTDSNKTATSYFIDNLLDKLPSQSALLCNDAFPSLKTKFSNATASDVIGNISKFLFN